MTECSRCKQKFKWRHPLDSICDPCLEKNPSLTAAERTAMNLWDKFEDFLKVFNLVKTYEWCWSMNQDCKYIELRIDMRDGGCIIKDRHGNRITPEQLAWQYSDKTPKKPQ